MRPFKSISTLRRFNQKASGDFSFYWYGDAATINHDTFTFWQPRQWKQNKVGTPGGQF